MHTEAMSCVVDTQKKTQRSAKINMGGMSETRLEGTVDIIGNDVRHERNKVRDPHTKNRNIRKMVYNSSFISNLSQHAWDQQNSCYCCLTKTISPAT